MTDAEKNWPTGHNDFGERLYSDTDETLRTIDGMIRHEPEWVASRFTHMEKRIAELEATAKRQMSKIASLINERDDARDERDRLDRYREYVDAADPQLAADAERFAQSEEQTP